MNKNRALPLKNLQDGDFTTDTAELDAICQNVGIDYEEYGITGAVVYLDESGADYKMVYLTESSRPYELQAIYHPLPYYREGQYNPLMPVYWKWYIYF